MKAILPSIFRRALLAAILLATLAGGPARAQNSSLFAASRSQQGLTLADSSWTAQPSEEMKTIKLNDFVTVVVDEKSAMSSNGQMDRKKKAYGDLALKDWIRFRGLNILPAPQNNGDPHIRGELDNKLQSKADLQTRDALKFRISCRIVDIRPNGNLVLEGRSNIQVNEEKWDCSLTGEIRPEAILPNNTILSENVADLKIVRQDAGHVRDGYRRGWALEWLDRWQPF